MDLIREIRTTLHGFEPHPLNNKTVLLKMINIHTKISAIKTQLAEKVKTPDATIDSIIHPECQLTFKQEVLYDDYTLLHYNFRNVLGANYAQLDLFFKEELAEQAVENVSALAKSRWALAGKKVRTKVHQAFIPVPNLASIWVEKSGHPYESASTRHASVRGGSKGVLDLLNDYPKHCTNAEECCWCLLTMAAASEEANEFRARLIEREGLTPIVVSALKRGLKKNHYGAIKQTLGLLWYLAKDQPTDYLMELVESKVMILCTQAIKIAGRGLSNVAVENKAGALASVLCDIAELSGNVTFELVKTKEGRSQWKKLKVKDVMRGIQMYFDGLIYPEYIVESFDRCVKQSKK